MPNLFGLNIAKLVADGLKSAGDVRPLTLTKSSPGSRTTGDLTSGTNPTKAVHSGRGFVEDRVGTINRAGTLVRSTRRIVSVIGATLPVGVKPEPSDVISIDGETLTIVGGGVKTDPAEAVFECEVGGT